MSGNWYDRVLDLLLGEDETSPKNRIVLICRNCRLVNGQAPPGTKSLAELGKWKCIGCGETNGEEDEAVRAVQEMKRLIHTQENNSAEEIEKKRSYGNSTGTGGEEIADIEDGNENESENDYEVEDESAGDKIEVSKPERERPKGSRKKN
jgi:predicted nucleic-acid-binding Zn-ribbon protein